MLVEIFKPNALVGDQVIEMDVSVMMEGGALAIHGPNADRLFRVLVGAGCDTQARNWSLVASDVEYVGCDIVAVGAASHMRTFATGFALRVDWNKARAT